MFGTLSEISGNFFSRIVPESSSIALGVGIIVVLAARVFQRHVRNLQRARAEQENEDAMRRLIVIDWTHRFPERLAPRDVPRQFSQQPDEIIRKIATNPEISNTDLEELFGRRLTDEENYAMRNLWILFPGIDANAQRQRTENAIQIFGQSLS